MIIPEKVKIGGIVYNVEVVDDLSDIVGKLELNKQLIQIANGKEDYMNVTFLHEVFHAMNVCLEETQVEFLAGSLYQIIKDNPIIFNPKGGEQHVSKKN